jgi:hypothetical protein
LVPSLLVAPIVDLVISARYASSAHRRPEKGEQEFVMTTFDKRKDAFENKFARDAELKFKAGARRNKLLGLWAAGLLGKTGEAAEEYAKAVVRADFQEAGDDDVFRKVREDLDTGGVAQSDHQIRRTMEELMAQAVEELSKEG